MKCTVIKINNDAHENFKSTLHMHMNMELLITSLCLILLQPLQATTMLMWITWGNLNDFNCKNWTSIFVCYCTFSYDICKSFYYHYFKRKIVTLTKNTTLTLLHSSTGTWVWICSGVHIYTEIQFNVQLENPFLKIN